MPPLFTRRTVATFPPLGTGQLRLLTPAPLPRSPAHSGSCVDKAVWFPLPRSRENLTSGATDPDEDLLTHRPIPRRVCALLPRDPRPPIWRILPVPVQMIPKSYLVNERAGTSPAEDTVVRLLNRFRPLPNKPAPRHLLRLRVTIGAANCVNGKPKNVLLSSQRKLFSLTAKGPCLSVLEFVLARGLSGSR